MAEGSAGVYDMMGEATAPVAVADSAHVTEDMTAQLSEAQMLAMQLDDAAKAAWAAAASISDPVERAALEANAAQLSGLAGAARSLTPANLRAGALAGLTTQAHSVMANTKMDRNEAVTQQLSEASSHAAAVHGTSMDYYSAQQFYERSYAAMDNMRDQLKANGEYATSTDTYFNSVTEAQYRTYEQDLQARIDAETDPEKKASLLKEQEEMGRIKWQQLNDEALKAHENWAQENPQLAGEMSQMFKDGKLPPKDGVPDPKLRESLAIIDADKFLEMAENNPTLKKALEGKEITEAERAQLSEEQKRALAWLETEGKNLTQEEKDKIHQAAEGLKEKAEIEREKNKDLLPKYQEESKAIREARDRGEISHEEAEAKLKALRDQYAEPFQDTERKIQQRSTEEKASGQAVGTSDHLKEQQEQKRLDGHAADGHQPPGAGHQMASRDDTAVQREHEVAAGQVREIAPGAASMTTQPAKEYSRTDFAQIFAGNTELAGLLAAMGVTGGQDIPMGSSVTASHAQDPQRIALMHQALNNDTQVG